MKQKRIVDEDLLDVIRCLPCYACVDKSPDEAKQTIGAGQKQSHAHHLITRGAGGPDLPWNLIPLCGPEKNDHHGEIHRIGIAAMAKKYSMVRGWLGLAGWIETSSGTWEHGK